MPTDPASYGHGFTRLTKPEQAELADIVDDQPRLVQLLLKAFPEARSAFAPIVRARRAERGKPGLGASAWSGEGWT